MSTDLTTSAIDGHPPLLSHATIRAAERRLEGRVFRTPVINSPALDRLAGARLWLKAENLQRGGSFKMRGALLAVEELAESGSRGVAALSTGNHGLGVALAARDLGMPALLVLPANASPTKVSRIRDTGAEIHLASIPLPGAMSVVRELSAERGFDVIDPFENPNAVAGQGTATAELVDQVAAGGTSLDAVVLPVGAGSAVAGACLAVAGQGITVFGAEPAVVPSFTEALRHGRPVNVPTHDTIADGLRPERVGHLPFDIACRHVTDVFTVDEENIKEALVLTLTHARQLIEPSSAVAVAAALRVAAARDDLRDVGVLLSGGNVEMRLVADLLAQAYAA
jgi:threo-3-hydroxy-L-aspartate ammonia-lyase